MSRRAGCGGGRRQGFAFDQPEQLVDAGVQARGEIPPGEFRRHGFANHALGRQVGHRTLKRACDFDSHPLVIPGDHHQQTVADALAADFPGLADAVRVVLDRFRLAGGHQQNRHLAAVGLLERGELAVQHLPVCLRQHDRRVDHSRVEWRDRHQVLRQHAGAGERQPHARHDGAQADHGALGAPCDGYFFSTGLSKLTTGGAEIAFSFSTVNEALV